jgi:GR25 family glycosyltransferase involved in LPS biosynthesis
MILIHKISNSDLEYLSDLKECLMYNILNPIIQRIVIFSDCPGIDKKLVIDLKSKKVLLLKFNIGIFEMMNYGKKNSKDFIIYSSPFIKFNGDLEKILKFDGKDILNDENSYYIFHKVLDIKDDRSIDDILIGKKIKINLKTKKLGYYKNKNSQSLSYEWRISKDYKPIVIDSTEFEIYPEPKVVEVPKVEVMVEVPMVEVPMVEVPMLGIESIRNRKRRIDVVIVSVNYNDFLIISLKNNIKFFENITIVTSPDDLICQKICDNFGVSCVVTDIMYEDGAVFNKGKAINKGIESISDPDYILLIDADILVINEIETESLDPEILYTSSRYILPDYDYYQRYFSGIINNDNLMNMPEQGLGFFQLFNYYIGLKYPESSNDASWSDILFRDSFKKRKSINNDVFHLGTDSNWKGRKSKVFLDNENFDFLLSSSGRRINFDINEYFDKIYCINLLSRVDRWENVSKEFESKGILVERFLATDRIKQAVNLDIDPEISSKIGILENGGALGCLLSHLNLIRDAKEKGYNRILVFEDDVVFSKDFNDRISDISDIDWKMLYLGASQFDWDSIEIKKGFYNCKKTLGTFAYCIDSSVYDDLITLLSSKIKSVDNYFSDFQMDRKDCYTFYPNIVVSMVSDSDIRKSKNIFEYSKIVKWDLSNFDQFKKVLLVPDVKGWAFDNIANAIVKYNPYPDRIFYETIYVTEIMDGKKVDIDKYDYIYVFFEAERIIPDSPKVIRGCYSAFWLEDKNITPKILGEYFSNCKATIFANDYLRNSISNYLPNYFPTTIIHDSADENIFYPIKNQKNENFTVIFVGNIKRPVKRFDDIVQICKDADVELIVCSDIKNSDLVNYYNKADVCINFSDFEGGPQTFLESSLCEVPMLIRDNNELSKIVPCFKGSTKEELVDILIRLKRKRKLCISLGKRAKEVVLEKFTYSSTAKKFADFFLNIDSYGKKNLTKTLTVFIIRSGKNPNYEDCLNSLNNQSVNFILKEIVDISPMSKAFQKMIDDCETEYYIQVDEDMILDENAIEKIYDEIISSDYKVAIVAHMLRDVHLDFNIYGVKGYKHEILKNYPYNLEIISCEVDQMKRMDIDGYSTLMIESVLGLHSPKWSPELIYERYFDLMEKWKNFKYHWMKEIPAKLLKIFQDNPSDINMYALMGAMISISTEEPIRNREKNFKLKDDNFERIKEMLQIKEFFHIVKK